MDYCNSCKSSSRFISNRPFYLSRHQCGEYNRRWIRDGRRGAPGGVDSITGGTIATGGVVRLAVDVDQTGYVLLPNGKIILTNLGDVYETYTGVSGAVTYYVPKSQVGTVFITLSTMSGNIYTTVRTLSFTASSAIKSITCSIDTTNIFLDNNNNLNTVIAPKIIRIDAQGCALTNKSIGDILYSAYIDNRMNVAYNFSGGTNAFKENVDAYLMATYGVSYAAVFALLDTTNNGTIIIDEAP